MRLATWNCFRGGCLERAAELGPFAPDVIVLQECARPAVHSPEGRFVWFGTNPARGAGVVVRDNFQVTAGPVDTHFDHSAFPAVVRGPTSFHLLAVWALPRPSYVRTVLKALDTYSDFLLAAPSVIAGDFNCFAQWHGAAPSSHHAELARRLREDFGLVSAYHVTPGYDPTVAETPTHFWRWKEDRPYHIDYCFVPIAWAEAVKSVHIETFADQQWRSDHRPLVVDLALPPGAGASYGRTRAPVLG